MNVNNAAAGACTASNEHAQLGQGVHSPAQTQGDTKALPATNRRSAVGSNRPTRALPNELLLHVFSYVEGKKVLANLCQCSKVFRDIADGYLYRNLNLYFPKPKNGDGTGPFKLLQSIQEPRYSSIVKELRVYMGPCPATRPTPCRDSCPCNKIDTMLRKALHYAEALEVLRIRCKDCRYADPERHCYLTELPTRKLRELCCECHCSRYSAVSNTKHVSAPNWVRSVSSLNLASGKQLACPEIFLRSWMENGDFLPNIHTLNYYGPGICSELLAKRVIRRLISVYDDPNDALKRHPDKKALTHLSICYLFLKRFLSTVENISQFSNLQHIGILRFEYSYNASREARLDARLGYIVDMKQLVSIEGHVSGLTNDSIETELWNQDLFKRLGSVHPKLRRLFLRGTSHNCVWVLREDSGVWEKCSIAYPLSWDIVTGVYDDI